MLLWSIDQDFVSEVLDHALVSKKILVTKITFWQFLWKIIAMLKKSHIITRIHSGVSQYVTAYFSPASLVLAGNGHKVIKIWPEWMEKINSDQIWKKWEVLKIKK